MLLIDTIVSMDHEAAVTRATIRDIWPTSDGQVVSALLVVELVAQTAGLVGGDQRLATADALKKGWLVGIKALDLQTETLPVGDTVVVTARNRFEFEGLKEVEGQVRIGDQVAGRVTLQVMQAPETNVPEDNIPGTNISNKDRSGKDAV